MAKNNEAPAQDLTLEQLSQQVANLANTVTALQNENAELRKLAAKPEAAAETPKPTIPADKFEVDGKQYQFIAAKLIYNKQEITATDALANEDILKDLVAKGSGLIKEVA